MHLHTHVYCSTIFTVAKLWEHQDALLPTNGLRQCGIYTPWNFTQPQRTKFVIHKYCELRTSSEVKLAKLGRPKLYVLLSMQIIDLKQMQ
jgi:hypothetical protein